MFALLIRFAHAQSPYINDLDLSEPVSQESLAYVHSQYVPEVVQNYPQQGLESPITGSQQVESIIRLYASKSNVGGDLMVSIAKCESGLKIDIKNPKSSASGIFQWLDSSWLRYSKIYGIIGDKNNPANQAELTAKVISNGGIGNWSESKICWGRN